MNSYVIYRITETLRVLLFMTLFFNFYPVTAVYGLFMTPLGWDWAWACFVWAYALVWFLVTDRIKLLLYRLLDTEKTAMP